MAKNSDLYEDDEIDIVETRSKKGQGNKKKKPINLKLVLLIEVIILIVLGIFYAIWSLNHAVDQIQYDEIKEEEIEINTEEGVGIDEETFKEMTTGYTSIALFGGDSRQGSVGKGAHSDAILVANINNETKEVKLVSVYRDSLLQIAFENKEPSTDKVTQAHFYGGPKMAINTLNRNLDLAIKDYVSVNFQAVMKAVDVVGGVEITLKKKELKKFNMSIKEQDKHYHTGLPLIDTPGTYLMNGTQALAYARIRNTDQGDITRTERQRHVISLVVAKVKKQGIGKLNELVDQVFPYISTSISKAELLEMAKSIFDYELTDNTGFPFTFGSIMLGKKGAVLPPATLETNVIALHKWMFDDENYQPSQMVKTISQGIITESGVQAKEIKIKDKTTTEESSDSSSEASTASN